jgi:5-methylthioadenosine/S-adenosylhomocysteine deaminase
VHTHASESRDEIAIVKRLSGGLSNVEYLASLNLASPRLCAAHCVWSDDREQGLLAEHGVKVMHCPSSNLKLGSGIAPVAGMRARGITVSLGADGAACNNALDMFQEMRLAATLQAMRVGSGVLTAREVVRMATIDGARTLGLEAEIGSVEVGKRADLVAVRTDGLHQQPPGDPFGTLVYTSRPTDVALTVIDGQIVARAGELTWADWRSIAAEGAQAAAAVRARAGV